MVVRVNDLHNPCGALFSAAAWFHAMRVLECCCSCHCRLSLRASTGWTCIVAGPMLVANNKKTSQGSWPHKQRSDDIIGHAVECWTSLAMCYVSQKYVNNSWTFERFLSGCRQRRNAERRLEVRKNLEVKNDCRSQLAWDATSKVLALKQGRKWD